MVAKIFPHHKFQGQKLSAGTKITAKEDEPFEKCRQFALCHYMSR